MAGTHLRPRKPSDSSRGGTAVTTRRRTPVLLWVILGLLLAAAVTVSILLLRLGRQEEEPEASPTPQATADPAATPVPSAMTVIPADGGMDIALQAARKRDGFPLLSWDTALFSLDSRGRMTYNDSSIATRTGIDVSEHQYDIDWAAVAADGIDFAIIRLGYRGSTAGGLYEDGYFQQNIQGALANGLDVGVYFYSQAISVEEAREEAAFVLERLEPYQITYPVVFDWEIVGEDEARTYTVGRRTLADCAAAFCQDIQDAGYDTMIYFTQYLGYRKYMLRTLTEHGFWYAEYEPQPRFAYDFDMWQYTCYGQVDGIEGEVDLNIQFLR